MKKILIANWKMNPASEREAISLARATGAPHVVLCPPFIYLGAVRRALASRSSNLAPRLGAQDVFWEDPPAGAGTFTGEISPRMLKELGVEYVIVGHSERRVLFHETDEVIGKKVRAALKARLKVILCVGEPMSIRKKGLAAAKNYVRGQLKKDLEDIHKSKILHLKSHLMIAYEPIWAIGTGKADDPKEICEMIKAIKNFLKTKSYRLSPRVLYGGSVSSRNANKFLRCHDIDGALVGGASLKVGEFNKIMRISHSHE